MESEEFKAWRLKRYRTQDGAARDFGVSMQTVWRWENGEGYPTGRLLELACKAIDRERQEREQLHD